MNKENPSQHSGKKQHPSIPPEISEYITRHFEEGFLSDIRELKYKTNNTFYRARVNHDGMVFDIDFNAAGKLIKHKISLSPDAENFEDNLPDLI